MDAREGREPAVALLRCPEELNPYADKGAKASILRMLDYARDPDDGDGGDDTGLVAEYGDTVMHGIWDDARLAPQGRAMIGDPVDVAAFARDPTESSSTHSNQDQKD